MKIQFLFLFFLFTNLICAQNYTSYFTGSSTDVVTNPIGGICLMGGASENDEAMKWFLNRTDGGDILVIRASGSDGYNDYFFSELGVNVNSVETIVFHNALASTENYIHQRINQAEAIWIAGGDQWNYVNYWRGTPIDNLINTAIEERNIVIGGTSAGMAIQGKFYFSAENGTVTTTTALNDPYDENVTIDSTKFLKNKYLKEVITDTHYDNPDRRGRHMTFLARILTDYGIEAKGIACNEFTSVCIDNNGIAKVYGEYPQYDEFAYFIQTNCELDERTPENCSPGNPLLWNLNNEAVKVYKVPGTLSGNNFLDLKDWKTGSGGSWFNWYIDNSGFNENFSNTLNCVVSETEEINQVNINLFPIPSKNFIVIQTKNFVPENIQIQNIKGQILVEKNQIQESTIHLDIEQLPEGVFLIKIKTQEGHIVKKFVKN